ncbi:hypothetical protein ACIBBB_17980 [Streptomyces sp. NPDC051217]|uniref:hypothetical protein n=1 Tax=Streptomyces sp. NPDC051217 TaxID=3365644 RepID=UPI0037A0B96B
MKAVVYDGTRRVSVHDVEDAALLEPTDALVRITSSALCGTDPHMYDGRTGAEPGLVLGQLFDRGVHVGFGRTHDRRYTRLLRDLVLDGRAHPEKVVTHHGSLTDAPRMYDSFDRRADGIVKAVLRP